MIAWSAALLVDAGLCRVAWQMIDRLTDPATGRDNPYASAGAILGTGVDLLYPVAGCVMVTILVFTIDKLTRAAN